MNKLLASFLLTLQVFLLSGNINLYASDGESSFLVKTTHYDLSSLLNHEDRQDLFFKAASPKSHRTLFDFFIDFAEVEEEEDDKSSSFKKLLAKNPYFTTLFLAQVPGYFFKTRLNQRFTSFERFSPVESCRRHVACQVFRI